MPTHPFLPPLGSPLVLASRSPRRADILRAHGLEFETVPAAIDESAQPGELPFTHVRRLATSKGDFVAEGYPQAVCLGCDTIVVIDGEMLGKPSDPHEAAAMLRRLSARDHHVHSAAALVHRERGYAAVDSQITRVRFRELSAEEIDAYVATGEPLDKAGAYGIQGYGALLVDSIEGGYFNVMGLPLQALRRLWLEYSAGEPGESSVTEGETRSEA